MTKLLQQAITEVQKLSAEEQDQIAEQIMAALDERSHGASLQLSEEQLAELRRRLGDPNPRLLDGEEFRIRLRRLGL